MRLRGVGVGLRWEFLGELVERTRAFEVGAAPAVGLDFLEVAPENYIRRGGSVREALDWLGERYPTVTHGLTLSLGGVDPLDAEYLVDVRDFVARVGSPWHSDHACFGGADGRILHELLPVAFTPEGAARMAGRVRRARDILGVPLAIENVSAYWRPGRLEMTEPEFLTRVCAEADCGLLLDVNNAYVNARNFGLDVDDWIACAPLDRVVEIHVAGHQWFVADGHGIVAPAAPDAPDAVIVDTHGADIAEPVLALLERVLPVTGPVPIVVERDQNVLRLDGVLSEVGRVRSVVAAAAPT